MNGILVRIGIDLVYGEWNAPVDARTGQFAYVPIPEDRVPFISGCERLYDEGTHSVQQFLADRGHDMQDTRFPIVSMRGIPMHLDPDFEHLTYGDDGAHRGSDVRKLGSGDLLVFYAGLRSLRVEDRQLVYAIVGVYIIDEVVPVQEVFHERRHENAHTRKATLHPTDIVVRARPGQSGRCARCVPIGEYRDRAYRVRRELLADWGGLSVNDGYIQRSARPPRFNDAGRFYGWWQRQQVPLVRSNFLA